jgi:hypothetical protein
MGDGDPRTGRSRECRRHAGHYLERNSPIREKLSLFASPAEKKRIAALEPDDCLPLARLAGQHFEYLFLARFVDSDRLAQVNPFRRRLRQGENLLLDQAVVDDDITDFEKLYSFDSQQLGVARAGAHQVYFSGRH